MGHRGDVYERYYMPNFIDRDTLGIYVGALRRDDLVQAVGRRERHENAPDDLNDAQKDEVRKDADVIRLIRCRERCAARIKQCGYSTIKAAHGTKWFERHKEKQRELNSLKAKLTRAKLDEVIDRFHETVHTEEVDRQMQGILPSPDVLNPSTIEYELEARATVARLLFQPLDDLNPGQMARVRIKVVEALAELGKQRETPHQFKKARTKLRSEGTDTRMDIDDRARSALHQPVAALVQAMAESAIDTQNLSAAPDLYCPFCKLREEVAPGKRNHVYARPDSLGRHIRDQHLAGMAANEGLDCPYEGCDAYLGGGEHFLSHTARQHLTYCSL